MANLSAFRHLTKLHKILLTSSISNSFPITSVSGTNKTLAALLHGTRFPETLSDSPQSQSLPSSPQLTNRYSPNYTSQKRHIGSDAQPTGGSSKIDEFRAREEKREEEFAKQQSESPPGANTTEQAKQTKAEAVRIKILEAALKHVQVQGWTRQAIVHGAEEAGYPTEVHGMFPSGGYDLVSYFVGKSNEALLKYLQEATNNGQKEVEDPIDFLCRAVKFRLQMIEPHINYWPQAMALIALPQNVSTSLAQVLTMVDDMCYFSGDRSVDFDWYTKRIGLATIYKMVEVYMLQDKSPGHEETWKFLKNRMEEAAQIQMVLQQTGDMKHNFQRSFNSAFITARNILGLNYDRR